MLEIRVQEDFWDMQKEEFVQKDWGTLQLEHSLISISKWESKWHKPFLNTDDKTPEMMLDYIRCMAISVPRGKEDVFNHLSADNIDAISAYINDSATATWFNEDPSNKSASKEIITAELIYYWMIANQIPFECQKWHLHRLLTLIRVCNIKNNPDKKKMSKREILSRNAALNRARRAKYHTTG